MGSCFKETDDGYNEKNEYVTVKVEKSSLKTSLQIYLFSKMFKIFVGGSHIAQVNLDCFLATLSF